MYVAINPGTGPVPGSEEAVAASNIDAFIVDVAANFIETSEITVKRVSSADYGEGRYAFTLTVGKRSCEIQMPGLPLARVRNSNAWLFPRLYVDGNSCWTQDLAVEIAREALTGTER